MARIVTAICPLADPLDGFTWSQLEALMYSMVAMNVAVPPVLVSVIFCAAGSGPFCASVKFNDAGAVVTETLAVMVSWIGIDNWKLGRLVELMVILPV